MTHKGSRPATFLLFIVLLVLLAVLVFGTYDIRTKNTEISRIINEVDRAAETKRLIQSIKEIQSNVSADLETFDNTVFTSDKLVPLIESIEDAGFKLGLETKIASVSEIEDKKSAKQKFIRMVIETKNGSWNSTLSFVKAVESLPHRVMVEETNVFKELDSWRLRMTISIHVFD